MSGEVSGTHNRSVGSVVRPQKVLAEKTVVQSVVDFISDVLPQGNVPHKANDKEAIVWIKIEQPERIGSCGESYAPIYLIFGYTNGLQIWVIEPCGEAWEVYSTRQGHVKTLRLLPVPEEAFGAGDNFEDKRPLIAYCDGGPSNSTSTLFSAVNIVSILTGDKVQTLKYRASIEEIYCNQRVLVVTFPEKFVVVDACTFKERFHVSASFPVHLVSPNPVALGKRWIAYSESKLTDMFHSCGGRMIDGVPSYTASVISAAKTISQGISSFGEAVASSLAGTKKFSPAVFNPAVQESVTRYEGVVTILDVGTAGENDVSLERATVNKSGVVAHFLAHSSASVAMLAFNPDGSLLLTASQTGQHLHVFRIQPHPGGSCLAVVHHLYTLHRGDTQATMQDVAFSLDSRWLAVTSMRATTHIFPITPYGGPITYRTHGGSRVVNKASRFHRSAGLDDLETAEQNGLLVNPGGSTASNAPSTTAVSLSPRFPPETGSSRIQIQSPPTNVHVPSLQRVPHLRPPLIVQPLIQVRHAAPTKGDRPTNNPAKVSANSTDIVKVSACFAAKRSRNPVEQQANDALFIATSHGALVEYLLQPIATVQTDKIPDESPVALGVHAQSQWLLNRHLGHPEFVPPFPTNHPLVSSVALSSSLPRSIGSENIPPDNSLRSLQDGAGERIVNLGNGRNEEIWLSQVEILTHAGPARRLWMGPQFKFSPVFSSACPATVPLSSLAQNLPVMRTGSDWDLAGDVKMGNKRLQSTPMNILGSSPSSCSLNDGSGVSMEQVGRESLSSGSSSSEELRLQALADAMQDVQLMPMDRDTTFANRLRPDIDMEGIVDLTSNANNDSINVTTGTSTGTGLGFGLGTGGSPFSDT